MADYLEQDWLLRECLERLMRIPVIGPIIRVNQYPSAYRLEKGSIHYCSHGGKREMQKTGVYSARPCKSEDDLIYK